MSIDPINNGKFLFYEYLDDRNNRSRFKDFVCSLNARDRDRFQATLKKWSEHGKIPSNKERFTHEQGKIYAYKQGQIRIYGFFKSSTEFVFTNGCLKKSRKANPQELERAEEIRQQWEQDNDRK